ncbi:ABC transporter permease [Nakamurella leprariae]|uniref:ABC transporter permease n=1 Tax=Nakamurella leprariae TaxID=2803911 RepID=A0A938YK08_9ACTN|nr:ABC transporter permease [Nakamurella leprariae]MBM9469293.1 ABC transporter permease [Nakamurella leprariae]
MIRYLLRRLGGAALVVVLVAVVAFVLFELLPGDAAEDLLSRSGAGVPSPEQLAALRAELGLDRPAVERFGDWASGLLQGDLGTSLLSRRPVSEILLPRVGNTVALAVVTVALLMPVSLGLGLWAGSRPGSRVDRAVSTVVLAVQAVPPFVAGVLLIAVVALGWGLLPAVSLVPTGTSVFARPQVLVLPVLCLMAGLAPHPVRVIRARMAQVMTTEYVTTARLNGVSHRRVVLRHAAPNAVAAALQPMAGAVVGLVGGIAVIETVFAYPGLAQELLRAIADRDHPVVQAAVVLMASFGVLVYLAADLLALWLTPGARDLVVDGVSR